VDTFETRMSQDVRDLWEELGVRWHYMQGDQRRIILYVQKRRSQVKKGVWIDLVRMGVDGKSSLYDCGKVTGIAFIVQAYLVTQRATVDVMRRALTKIEQEDAQSVTFACDHGTHRSVGCAVLFASLFFPKAEIIFCTPRTQRAAISCKMIRTTYN